MRFTLLPVLSEQLLSDTLLNLSEKDNIPYSVAN
jgi:hypothetical protein